MSSTILDVRPLGFPWETADPFLFCVHHYDRYPAGNDQMAPVASLAGRNIGQDFSGKDGWSMYHGETIPGFPQHPHRGFETVTVVRRGLIDHSDSLGAAARFGNGDTQWLTTGRGVNHSEMFPLLRQDQENTTDFFQIWLNLPRSGKMAEPYFTMFWEDRIPIRTFTDDQGQTTSVRIVAGELDGATPPSPPPDSWASRPEAHVAIWTIEMEPDARWKLPASVEGVNRTLYVYGGASVTVDGREIPSERMVRLRPDADVELVAGSDGGSLLLLQGRPIGEPVVQHGPFVMNSAEEIQQTFLDYRRTQFGGWPWPSNAPVHPREKGRFARHADGRIEEPTEAARPADL